VSRTLTIALQAGLVAGLAFVLTGFVRSDHDVQLQLDGRSVSVHTYANTVGGLLAERNVKVSDRDLVEPSTNTPLDETSTVTVRHARPLEVVVDGKPSQIWTTALTVDDALRQAGVRTSNAELSASRSDRVPLSGARIGVQMPDQVTVLHDQRRTTVVTTAQNVAGVLKDVGIPRDNNDIVNLDPQRRVKSGMQIQVTRVGVKTVHHRFTIRHDVVRKADAHLYEDQTKVVQHGRDGVGLITAKVVRHDGVVVKHQQLSSKVLRKPVSEVVLFGTKTRPFTAPSTGAEGLNWSALAGCESGGNPQAVNAAGYYGLYQFSLSTWYSVGGTGNPVDASSEEQTYRAQLLFQSSGSSPWPVCGPLLYS
jgi:uncharacterized protein YabE (DUF348 family)